MSHYSNEERALLIAAVEEQIKKHKENLRLYSRILDVRAMGLGDRPMPTNLVVNEEPLDFNNVKDWRRRLKYREYMKIRKYKILICKLNYDIKNA